MEQFVQLPRGCHPERSVAKSKDPHRTSACHSEEPQATKNPPLTMGILRAVEGVGPYTAQDDIYCHSEERQRGENFLTAHSHPPPKESVRLEQIWVVRTLHYNMTLQH